MGINLNTTTAHLASRSKTQNPRLIFTPVIGAYFTKYLPPEYNNMSGLNGTKYIDKICGS